MSIKNLLKMKCKIERKTNTFDDYGNASSTWTTIKNNAKCFIEPVSGSRYSTLNIQPSGLEAKDLKFLYCLPDEDILIGDRITETSFGIMFVEAANPSVRGLTGKSDHKECLISNETT